jgi:exodeoxyribonuclease VII large subunit
VFLEQIEANVRQLDSSLVSLIDHSKHRLKSAEESYGFRRPFDIITQRFQKTDELIRQLENRAKNYLEIKSNAVSLLKEKVNTLSPSSVLKRGYSITRKLPELKVITDAGILKEKDRIEVKMFKGRVESKVELIDPDRDRKR